MSLDPSPESCGIETSKKKLIKADPNKQVQFVLELSQIEKQRSPNGITVYIDEVHFYVEADLRRMWAYKGEPTLIPSSSPGRKKVNLYGAAAPELGDFFLWEAEVFNGPNTAEFLRKVREHYSGRRVDLVMDNGPQHKGYMVRRAFEKTRIHVHRLPGYSPELNAIEPLWRWFREELTYNFCHENRESLKRDIFEKEREFKNKPAEIKRRLKPDLSKIRHLLDVNV